MNHETTELLPEPTAETPAVGHPEPAQEPAVIEAPLVPSGLREQAVIARGRDMDATTFDADHHVFSSGIAFQLACKMADMMAASTVLPEAYQGKPANCLIAIEFAARLKVSAFQLAQNMDVVKGRPGLRGTFLAALINACPLFSRLRYEWRGTDNPGKAPSPDFGCRALATELATGDVLEGAWIDWRMVTGEGWDKNAKWTTMREQMFTYRAASFWSRRHASDITLGLHDIDELRDAAGEYGRGRLLEASPATTSAGGMAAVAQALRAQQADVEAP